jgi:hypothetical protein
LRQRLPSHAGARRAFLLLAPALALVVAAGPGIGNAIAQTSSDNAERVAALRAQADEIANRYFSALIRSQELDKEISHDTELVDGLHAREQKARDEARARALVAYKTSTGELAALIDSEGALDTARRAHLINGLNARSQATYNRLRSANRQLRKEQRALEAERQTQADALARMRDEATAMNTKLAEAQQQERAAAVAAFAAAAPPEPTTSPPATEAAPVSESSTEPPTTTTAAPPHDPTPPPDYTGTPGANPHHDDVFLTCVRMHESRGNYGAASKDGKYHGAYQFGQDTWNGIANHAKPPEYTARTDLIGLAAELATQYDQDEMAWRLYQWQGKGPWTGTHC